MIQWFSTGRPRHPASSKFDRSGGKPIGARGVEGESKSHSTLGREFRAVTGQGKRAAREKSTSEVMQVKRTGTLISSSEARRSRKRAKAYLNTRRRSDRFNPKVGLARLAPHPSTDIGCQNFSMENRDGVQRGEGIFSFGPDRFKKQGGVLV